MFQKTLPGLPPCREIEHKIEILGTLPKPTPIYKLSPLKDETLRNHLNNAVGPMLISKIGPKWFPKVRLKWL